MKKFIQLLIFGVLLASCSGLPNINLPQFVVTATAPAATATPTPLPSATPLPTQNLFATFTGTPLTFTPTVTAIGAELFTPTNTATPFPTAALPTIATIGLPTLPSESTYFTPKSTGFLSILTSSNIIYWNEGPCMPRDIKMSAFVADQIHTDKVVLFMRLREKKNTLNLTDWGAGAIMTKADNGSFNYDIRTFNIHHYYYFREAWIEYQLVAFTQDMQVIGRTPVYDRNLTLAMCRPIQ